MTRMNVVVACRARVERGLKLFRLFALVSITDPGLPPAALPSTTMLRGVLRLAFNLGHAHRNIPTFLEAAGAPRDNVPLPMDRNMMDLAIDEVTGEGPIAMRRDDFDLIQVYGVHNLVGE